MFDNCELLASWLWDELIAVVVEHSAGPSNPPKYRSGTAGYAGSRPAGGPGLAIDAVEYEGFERDEGEEEEGEDSRMVQAVGLPQDALARQAR